MDTTPKDALIVPPDRAQAKSEIGGILRLAIDKGVSVDTIERLVALKEREEERFAVAEFNQALASFQSECPSIPKTSTAKIVSDKGSQYSYSYAELDTIAKHIQPFLTKHGLAYSWDSDLVGDKLVCVCTLRHIAGHMQEAKFVSPTDSKAGMSSQQKFASALTYARRQALVQVLGLTTTDPDSDGAGEQKLGEQQRKQIEDLVRETGVDSAKFLAYMGVAALEEIQARDYRKALNVLNDKKRAKAGGA